MPLIMYAVQQAPETPLVPTQICTKTCLKFTLWQRGVIKSLHCIFDIHIRLVSKNKYIWYSYSVRYLQTNIFDGHYGVPKFAMESQFWDWVWYWHFLSLAFKNDWVWDLSYIRFYLKFDTVATLGSILILVTSFI